MLYNVSEVGKIMWWSHLMGSKQQSIVPEKKIILPSICLIEESAVMSQWLRVASSVLYMLANAATASIL